MNTLALIFTWATAVGVLTLLVSFIAAIGSSDKYADDFYTFMIYAGIVLAAVGTLGLLFTGKATL